MKKAIASPHPFLSISFFMGENDVQQKLALALPSIMSRIQFLKENLNKINHNFIKPNLRYFYPFSSCQALEDSRKLERVLGYLQMSKGWVKVIDRNGLNHILMLFYRCHMDGKSQSACLVMSGNMQKQKIVMKI